MKVSASVNDRAPIGAGIGLCVLFLSDWGLSFPKKDWNIKGFELIDAHPSVAPCELDHTLNSLSKVQISEVVAEVLVVDWH